MGKKADAKLFIAYILIIILSLFAIVKCDAQTIGAYTEDFFSDASLWNVTLTRKAPIIVEIDERLHIVIKTKRIYVDAYSDGYNSIYFDISSTMYQYNLKVLVYHEYGHWYLWRDETNSDSIMNTDIWSKSWESLLPETQIYYIKELFNN